MFTNLNSSGDGNGTTQPTTRTFNDIRSYWHSKQVPPQDLLANLTPYRKQRAAVRPIAHLPLLEQQQQQQQNITEKILLTPATDYPSLYTPSYHSQNSITTQNNNITPLSNNITTSLYISEGSSWGDINSESTVYSTPQMYSVNKEQQSQEHVLQDQLDDTIYTVNNVYSVGSGSYTGVYSSGSSNSSYDANQVSYANESTPNDLGHYEDFDEKSMYNVGALGDSTSESEYTNRNWNDIFQALLDLPCSERKYKNLSNVASDFVYCADTFGKIIISELHLPWEGKTIKPLDLGGVGGGLKFMCQDIIFKFVVDTELLPGLWMYGNQKRSDEKAQKSASLEIKGINNLMEKSNGGLIRFPLVAIIDYRGYRLLAIARLPINKQTIVYGSCDGGATVHNSDPVINAEMERLTGALNLQAHKVGRQGVTMHGPGDIEVHRGLDDRYYMIDFARLFPPEFSVLFKGKKDIGREIFYNMLRPELVSQSTKPLSSDGFSGWQTNDPNDAEYNQNIIDITEKLHKEIIPQTLALIESSRVVNETVEADAHSTSPDMGYGWTPKNGELVDSEDIASIEDDLVAQQQEERRIKQSLGGEEEFEFVIKNLGYTKNTPERDYRQRSHEIVKFINFIHSRGINLRYLGVLCRGITNASARSLYMTEVVARIWKRIIRSRSRLKMDACKMVSEGPYKQIVSDIFNVILSTDRSKHRDFWTLSKPGYFKHIAVRLFPRCLSQSDRSPDVDVRTLIDCRLLVLRIIQILNIRIHPEAYKQFLSNPSYIISQNDIEEVGSTVKYLGIVDFTIGTGLLYQTERLSNASRVPPLEVSRWLDVSQAKLQAALRSMPRSLIALRKLAYSYLLRANVAGGFLEAIEQLKTALGILRQSQTQDASTYALHGMIQVKLATFYLFYSRSGSGFRRELSSASEKLELALKLQPSSIDEHIFQALPIYTTGTSCNAYIGQPSRTIANDSRRINELFSLVYLADRLPKERLLKSYLSDTFKKVNQVVRFVLPKELSGVMDTVHATRVLHSIPNIDLLSLIDITLTPSMASSIIQMKQLKTFKLQNVKFAPPTKETADDPNSINSFNDFFKLLLAEGHQIESLILQSTSIKDEVFEGVHQGFKGIKEIELVSTSLTDATLLAIAPYLKQLGSLSIIGNNYSDAGVTAVIQTPRKLEKLVLDSIKKETSKLTDSTAAVIVARSLSIRNLQLNNVNFSADKISDIVKNAPGIETVNLSYSNANALVVEGLEYHGAECLRDLYLDNTKEIVMVEEYLEMLGNIQPRLKSLHLPRFTPSPSISQAMIQLLRRLPDLEKLKFCDDFNVLNFVNSLEESRDRGEYERPLHQLVSLDISSARFNIESLQVLMDLSPNLESLSLVRTVFVDKSDNEVPPDDLMLITLSLLFFNLMELDLSETSLEKRNVVCLLSRCPRISLFHLRKCPEINSNVISQLSKEYPHIEFQT